MSTGSPLEVVCLRRRRVDEVLPTGVLTAADLQGRQSFRWLNRRWEESFSSPLEESGGNAISGLSPFGTGKTIPSWATSSVRTPIW